MSEKKTKSIYKHLGYSDHERMASLTEITLKLIKQYKILNHTNNTKIFNDSFKELFPNENWNELSKGYFGHLTNDDLKLLKNLHSNLQLQIDKITNVDSRSTTNEI